MNKNENDIETQEEQKPKKEPDLNFTVVAKNGDTLEEYKGSLYLRMDKWFYILLAILSIFVIVGARTEYRCIKELIDMPIHLSSRQEYRDNSLYCQSLCEDIKVDTSLDKDNNKCVVTVTRHSKIPSDKLEFIKSRLECGKELRVKYRNGNGDDLSNKVIDDKTSSEESKAILDARLKMLISSMYEDYMVDEYSISKDRLCETIKTETYDLKNGEKIEDINKAVADSDTGVKLLKVNSDESQTILNIEQLPKEGSVMYLSTPEGVIVY